MRKHIPAAYDDQCASIMCIHAAAATASAVLCLAGALRQEVTDEVLAAAQRLREDHPDAAGATLPTAIVACSAVSGAL